MNTVPFVACIFNDLARSNGSVQCILIVLALEAFQGLISLWEVIMWSSWGTWT